jgi:hypothetical protein
MQMFNLTVRLSLILVLLLGGCTNSGPETVENIVQPPDPPPPPPPTNQAPVISGLPPTAIMANQNYSFTPTASDPDGDEIAFSVANLPAWAIFDDTSGNISGTPSGGDEGFYADIMISVSDGALSAELTPFGIDVVVAATGQATVGWVAPQEDSDGNVLTDLAGFRLYYGTQSGVYPNTMEIESPGLTLFVLDQLVPNTYFMVLTATNSLGQESEVSNEIVIDVE